MTKHEENIVTKRTKTAVDKLPGKFSRKVLVQTFGHSLRGLSAGKNELGRSPRVGDLIEIEQFSGNKPIRYAFHVRRINPVSRQLFGLMLSKVKGCYVWNYKVVSLDSINIVGPGKVPKSAPALVK